MYRLNRIGPSHLADIEVPPWEPGGTLLGVIDDNAGPTILGGVRSITVPETTNCELIRMYDDTMTPTGAGTQWALGCLINGTIDEKQRSIIFSVSGFCWAYQDDADGGGTIFPIISKLDSTPSDPDAAITITDYTILPCQHHSYSTSRNWVASVNCQIVIGNIRGSTATLSEEPIFVGWAKHNKVTTAYVQDMHASISVYKYHKDLDTIDPSR